MKQDITNLTVAEQLCLTMDILRRRHAGGQKVTHPCDLLDYFKHRAFRNRKQRVEHCAKLLHIASEALSGHNVEKLVRQAAASRIIFEVGDQVIYQGERARVIDLMPDDLVGIISLSGGRVVRRADLQPADRALSSQHSALSSP